MRLPATAFYSQRNSIAEDADELRELSKLINWPNDLSLGQACHWYAVALEYKPDLILELGRGMGNSTAIFTQAANRIGDTKVKSYCNSFEWDTRTLPWLRTNKKKEWFEPVETFICDITTTDFTEVIEPYKRILLLWDAHGYEVADRVLTHIMPLLSKQEHIVICHDVSDNRLYPEDRDRSYGGLAFWRGMDDHFEADGRMARANIFWLDTIVGQFVPILDFCYRNRIELHSADWEVKVDFLDNDKLKKEFLDLVPSDCFQEMNHWVYFSLNEAPGACTFPAKMAKT